MQIPGNVPLTVPPAQKKRGSGNWLRRFEHLIIQGISIIFSIAAAKEIWWYFSALNQVDPLQWVFTILMAVAFAGLGYIITRSLAHRLHRKEKIGMVLVVSFFYEVVEVGCCFSEAAVAIQHIGWIGSFTGFMRVLLSFLQYAVLSCIPIFTVALGYLDMVLSGSHENDVLVQPVPKQTKKGQAAAPGGVPQPLVPPSPYGQGYQPAGQKPVPPGQTINFNGSSWQPSSSSVTPGVSPLVNAPNPNIPDYDRLVSSNATTQQTNPLFFGQNRQSLPIPGMAPLPNRMTP